MSRLSLSLIVSLLVANSNMAQDGRNATERLTKQGEQFQEQVIKVADNVYTAVGFSVSNVSMVVGDDGVVIVDTGMMLDDASRIATEFRKLSDKPVKAIIFTHAHGDHTGGAAAFLGDKRPQIWAHQNFGSEALPLRNGGVTFQRVRGARQGRFKLPPEQRLNNGIAPVRYPKRGAAAFASDNNVQLPEHLASKDYLQPFYGHPEWGVRSVFNGYLGWFDGNPSNLFRLSPKSEAERFARLAGGQDKLLAATKDAVAADDNQWAAQLADHLLAINKDNLEAKQLKVDALTNLAREMVNATARNYYLTVARELREELKTD